MPRQRRAAPARSAPSRPAVAPARPAGVAPPQQRSASTAAYPGGSQAQSQAPGQQRSGGMLSNIASTAAGVAIGSSIGHGISSLFGGGSSSMEQQVDPLLRAQSEDPSLARSCETDSKAFTKCLDENRGEHAMNICGWYFDQLKACQQAAKPY